MFDTELRRKVAWLIAVRAIIGSALLGSATFMRMAAPTQIAVDPFLFLICLLFALTLVFALMLKQVESDRLNTTIRSFLDYARPQRFAVKRFDIRRALSDTALLLRNSSDLHEHHAIVVDVPESEVWYDADEGQTKQIVWNLATNGLRAMPDGGRLRLGAAAQASAEGVVLTVIDEGAGIPQAEMSALFQPFHGGFAKGSGLGLAIVHRIVTDYNGTIEFNSDVGKGTTVAVRLPARSVVAA